MRTAIKVPLIIFVLFFIVIPTLMAALKICPPPGPWPSPPWCEGGVEIPPIPVPQLQAVVTKELALESAIVVPTNISKIDYPSFYKQIKPTNATINNPYCLIDSVTVTYQSSYLGGYALPEIQGAPLPPEVRRAVGIKDHWVSDPNVNRCPIFGNKMFEAFEKTLPRVKALGGQQIHVTNYVSFKDFHAATLDLESKAIPDNTLRQIAEAARGNNLDVVLYLNVAPGNQAVGPIPNSTWLEKFIDSYEPFLLNQAKIAQESGIRGMMINHFDYQPGIKGYEEVYQRKMSDLLEKIRAVYTGEIILLIEPIWGADLNKVSTLLNKVDAYLYTPTTTPLASASDKTVSVSNIKGLYSKNLDEIARDFARYKKPIYIRILVQSEKDFLVDGWDEDSFCVQKGNDPCYQKSLEPDFSLQAVAYEALMESLKDAHQSKFQIAAVDTYGYWYTDVILANFSHPQIAQSIRNKPAESIVREWFRK